MDGIEIVKKRFENDPYAKHSGIILDDLTDDYVSMHMELKSKFNNFNGSPHGGIIFSLADVAFSVIANCRNILTVGLSCNIFYHASPNPGDILYVEGKRIKESKKIGTYEFRIYTTENEEETEIATLIGNSYLTGKCYESE